MRSRGHRSRVLIAVEPHVLGDALAGLVSENGDDVVVLEPDELQTVLSGHYDTAVVTIVLPDSIDADVVIELPDHEGNRGTGRVTTRTESREVRMDSLEDLLGLLDGIR